MDFPGLDEGKEYRQCDRCGDIYALGDLKRQRKSEELEEQLRYERDHNWRPPSEPDELTKSLPKKGKSKSIKNVFDEKKSRRMKLVKGKLRRIQRTKIVNVKRR